LHEQVDRLGLDDYVSVGGPIHAEAKEAFLRHADAYIHPSNLESHSVALVEVLERGIPAVVSSSTHIAPVLVEADAAVVSEIVPDALDLALQRVETEGARCPFTDGSDLRRRSAIRCTGITEPLVIEGYRPVPREWTRCEAQRASSRFRPRKS